MRLALGLVLANCRLKLDSCKQLQPLTENAAFSIHGGDLALSYWGQPIMQKFIRPVAAQVGIVQHIGWHTFRRTYSTLLRATRADIKVMQELLSRASSRVTLDTFTQAVTLQKRKAQSKVVRLLRASTAEAG